MENLITQFHEFCGLFFSFIRCAISATNAHFVVSVTAIDIKLTAGNISKMPLEPDDCRLIIL